MTEGNSLSFTIQLREGSTALTASRAVTVPITYTAAATNGLALSEFGSPGTNLVKSGGNLSATIPKGSNQTTYTLPLTNDNVIERAQSATLALSSTGLTAFSGGSLALAGSNTSFTVNSVESRSTTVVVSYAGTKADGTVSGTASENLFVREGANLRNGQIRASFANAALTADDAVTVNFAVVAGAGTPKASAADFNDGTNDGFPSGTITIAKGAKSGVYSSTSGAKTFTAKTGGGFENLEKFKFDVTSVSPGFGGKLTAGADSRDYTISEPRPTVQFSAATASVNEGGTASLGVAVSAAPGSSTNFPLGFSAGALGKAERGSLSGSTVTSGDYHLPQNMTVAASATSGTATIRTRDDNVVEGAETATVSFGTLPSPYAAGARNQVTLTVNDNDVGHVKIKLGTGTGQTFNAGGTIPAGRMRAVLESADSGGTAVSATRPTTVFWRIVGVTGTVNAADFTSGVVALSTLDSTLTGIGGRVVIPAAATNVNIPAIVLASTPVEIQETFKVEVAKVTNALGAALVKSATGTNDELTGFTIRSQYPTTLGMYRVDGSPIPSTGLTVSDGGTFEVLLVNPSGSGRNIGLNYTAISPATLAEGPTQIGYRRSATEVTGLVFTNGSTTRSALGPADNVHRNYYGLPPQYARVEITVPEYSTGGNRQFTLRLIAQNSVTFASVALGDDFAFRLTVTND